MKTCWMIGLCALLSAGNIFSQKSKIVVLTYKYKPGDQYRVTTSTYRNFSTTSAVYSHSSYGETAFDVYQEVTAFDGKIYDMNAEIELTRYTREGENLTYKLQKILSGETFAFAFDRFGKILEGSVKYEKSTDIKEKDRSAQLKLFENIFVPLPLSPITIGDKWKIDDYYSKEKLYQLFGSEYGITSPSISGEYKLESVVGTMARISLSVDVTGDGKFDDGQRKFGVNFLFKITGEYEFSIADGKMKTGNVTAEMAGVGMLDNKEVEFTGTESTSFVVEKIK